MTRERELYHQMTAIAHRGLAVAQAGDLQESKRLFEQLKPLMLEYARITGDLEYVAVAARGQRAHEDIEAETARHCEADEPHR